jgi:hypothetical protein
MALMKYHPVAVKKARMVTYVMVKNVRRMLAMEDYLVEKVKKKGMVI